MLLVMQGSWALLLGMLFLQLGNGLQGTLLSVRGELEDFSTFEMSVVMSAYFVGFLGASRLVPVHKACRSCQSFCSFGLTNICDFNPISSLGEPLDLDGRKNYNRFLLLWCLYNSRKLVE